MQHGFKQGISKFLALNKNVHSCFKRLADRQENKQTGFWLPISRALPSSYTILKDLIGVVDCQNREGNLLFKFARVNRGLHLLFMSNKACSCWAAVQEITVI